MASRLLLVLVCLLCLGLLPALGAEEVPPAMPAVSVLVLKYANAKELAVVLAPPPAVPGKGLQELLPAGVQQVAALSENRLLVVARDREAVEQVAALVKMLDVATRQVSFELMLVKVMRKDLPLLQERNLRLTLNGLLARSMAKILRWNQLSLAGSNDDAPDFIDNRPTAARLLVPTGGQGVVETFPMSAPQSPNFPQTLWLTQIMVHPDDTVAFDMLPIFPAATPGGLPVEETLRGQLGASLGSRRVKTDTPLLITEEQLTGRPLPAKQDTTTVLIITVTVPKPLDRHETPNRPPLF